MVRRPRRRLFLAFAYPALIGAIVLSQSAGVPTQTPAPTQYGVQGFGPDGVPSAAAEVSEFGSPIVGHVRSSSGARRAAFLSYDRYVQLGTLGGAESEALGGYFTVVVGRAQNASGQFHAFRADIGGLATPALVDLGTLGGPASVANAAEYSNVVVGSAQTSSGRWQAFVSTNGAAMSALPVGTQGDSSANDIHNGQVVGYTCSTGNASCRAFWVKDGVSTTLPTLGGNSSANAINGWEQIVGGSKLASGAQHAFVYANGSILDLQTLGGANSEALDINEAGHVVGVSDTSSGAQHAFLYRDGVMTDLNTLVPASSGWVLQRATGITAGGQIVGIGTVNGVSRGFLLTPPADVRMLAGGQRSQADSNLPRGVEVGRTIRYVNTVWATPDPLAVYGTKLTATLTGPAEYVGPVRGYDTDGSECHVSAKTITCDVPGIDTITFGREYSFTARATGPGEIRHTVTAVNEVPDPNPANNSLTERNYAVALADLTLTPSTIAGGKASSARVTLTGLPPAGDAVVRLTSSRPDVAPVPATLIVPAHANSNTRAFNIVPAVVAQPTPVQISATYGLVTVTRTLTVVPPALAQLYLTPTTVVGGCGTSAGKIALTGAAPAGGAVVALTNTNSKAAVPASVTVPAGASSQTFTVKTSTVTSNATGSVTATFGGTSQTLTLTVRPIRVKTLTLSPNPVTGGANATGSVTLECAAPVGGLVVTLSSSNAPVAAPTVASITIPAGATTGSFSVRTARVTASTNVTIYASAYGVRKGTALTVRP